VREVADRQPLLIGFLASPAVGARASCVRVVPAVTGIADGWTDHDPGYTGQVPRQQSAGLLADGIDLLAEYQDRLAAQNTYGALLVLQGLDASGKDSTIKHVMSGVNPQGVEVRAFKQPSAEELDHDFLWRYQRALPGRGRIGIFKRSHYEEVLVVRVHPELLAAERYSHRQGHPERVQAGAGQAVPQAHRPSRYELEVLAQ
jgi:hypothetical protein